MSWNGILLKEVDSTQAFIKRSWKTLAHRTYVCAEHQTAGQGRENRSWFSPPGGLYVSLLIKPEQIITPINLQVLLIVLRILEKKAKQSLILKAPNDILYKDKKVSGILIDGAIQGTSVQYYIVGIGINIKKITVLKNHNSSMLEEICQQTVDKSVILEEILQGMDKCLSMPPEQWLDQTWKIENNRTIQIGYQNPSWVNLKEYWNGHQ